MLDEFEAKLLETHNKIREEDSINSKATKAKKAHGKRGAEDGASRTLLRAFFLCFLLDTLYAGCVLLAG